MKDVRDVPFAATEGLTRTYKKSLVATVVITVAGFLMFAAIFSSKGPYAVLALAVAGILIFVPLGLEFRRSIVVSPAGFEYRWRSGKVVRIAWADVEKVEETTTLYMLVPLRPVPVPGVEVILRSGEKLTFPLDFAKRQREEIVKRLRGAVSSIEEGSDLSLPIP
jgi:hypothetical protein